MAADTVEPWEAGAADVDLYVGYDGLGLQRGEGTGYGDLMLGAGVGYSISVYVGTTLTAHGFLTNRSAVPYVGSYATPLDSDHVDLDFFLTLCRSSDGLQVTPAFELNLDAAQDLAEFGAYIRAGLPICGPAGADHPDASEETTTHVESTVGAYKTFGDHQLLVELDMALRPDPSEDERETEVGGVALGWNLRLSDTLEWINQAAADIPQDDEDLSFGVMTGFIATLGPPAAD